MDKDLLTENEFLLFKSKDTRVFKKVYDKYFGLVRYVACRCGFDADASDDIVQETFIRLYNKSEKILDQRNLSSWLTTTARNLCLDQTRKHKVESKYSEQELLNEQQQSKTRYRHTSFTSESEIHELELSLIGELIDKVTTETKDETFSLFYRDGLSAKAIAARQNTPVSTVTNRLSRRRKQFRDFFEDHIKQLHEELL